MNRRGGKVYIDFLQNRRGQTVVPPYVARPVPGSIRFDAARLGTSSTPSFTAGRLAAQFVPVRRFNSSNQFNVMWISVEG